MKKLLERLERLPQHQQEVIEADLADSLESRIKLFEGINRNVSREEAEKMVLLVREE